jgi:asparagine synthetase B (glutamine-hydrolysing)
LRLRLLNILEPPHSETPVKAKLAILFSGGLDCTVLARIAHDILPLCDQIDLINVAFENPRVVLASKQTPKAKGHRKVQQGRDLLDVPGDAKEGGKALSGALPVETATPFEECPDRITGRNALKELRCVCPERKWNFVEVGYSETSHIMLLTLHLGQCAIRRILSSQKQSHISYIPT